MLRIYFFSETKWAYGTIYRSIIPYLNQHGIYSDLVDWRVSYDIRDMHFMNESCDYWITTPSDVGSLLSYGCIPLEKIIIICHGQMELLTAIERSGTEIFDKVKNYAVVSNILLEKSKEFGIKRIPKLVKVGVEPKKFKTSKSKNLSSVGYTATMKANNYNGEDIKRGFLAKKCVQETGLNFVLSTDYDRDHNMISYTSYLGMPAFYNSVDCIIMSSTEESVGLPILEASVCGKLIIGTPVGYLADNDIGIKVSLEEHNFIKETKDILSFYRDNPIEYQNKCEEILEKSKIFHWENCIQDWIKLFEEKN